MSRCFPPLSAVLLAALAFACNDELVQDVDPEVCVSEMRWVGGKRASPEMYPGRDCVGCHLKNDGPELMLGGTVYPFVQYAATPDAIATFKSLQSGEDCFGLEGVEVKITGDDGNEFVVTTNRAGNFFVEGRPEDLKKPFKVELTYEDPVTGFRGNPSMATAPSYGGCAKCHSLGVERTMPNTVPDDEVVSPANALLGVPGYIDLPKMFPATTTP